MARFVNDYDWKTQGCSLVEDTGSGRFLLGQGVPAVLPVEQLCPPQGRRVRSRQPARAAAHQGGVSKVSKVSEVSPGFAACGCLS